MRMRSLDLAVVPRSVNAMIGNGPMQPNGEPPTFSIARLVCLYHTRGLYLYQWETHPVPRDSMDNLIKRDLMKMRTALAIAIHANRFMGSSLGVGGAAAYILMEDGQEPSIVDRFMAPKHETIMHGDPRQSLARI